MKPGILITTVLSGCFALCFVGATSLSGKWAGALRQADSSAYPLTYNFTLIGDSVAGTSARRTLF